MAHRMAAPALERISVHVQKISELEQGRQGMRPPTSFDKTHTDEWTDVLALMQTARAGSRELDARIDCILFGRSFLGMGSGCGYVSASAHAQSCWTEPIARWSEDMMAPLRLIPNDHNYSIGRRDGVCWAWIQPNDNWTPIGTEYQHDHPLGSGLVVANTMALALMAAALILTWQHWIPAPSDKASKHIP